MKDFDAERTVREDREFRIGGRLFRFRPSVQQELLDAYFDSMASVEGTNAELLAVMDHLILGGLEPEFHDEWKLVRSAEVEAPLMGDDIHGVIRYMIEVMMDRPTVSPSDSGITPDSTGTSLTDKSPSSEAKS
jgi:hypothetical protein